MNKKNRLIFWGIIVFSVLLIFASKHITKKYHTAIITDALDTVTEITVLSRNNTPIKKAESYIKKMDTELSAHNENSLLFKYNNGENVEFSNDAAELIKQGDEFSQKYPEYFSIYLEPLIKGWNIKNNNGTIPDVSSLLIKSDEQKYIDLGGIAKGYITGKIVEILKADGITSAMINLGGNAYAIGKKSTGEPWRIGVANPKNPEKTVGVISAENLAVITSGDYHRYFEIGDKRYSHILNPVTGYPADTELCSVTIISKDATTADFLSTAVFVAGLEKGKELLKNYNSMGILITDTTIYFSKELSDIFKQIDFSYKYEFLD